MYISTYTGVCVYPRKTKLGLLSNMTMQNDNSTTQYAMMSRKIAHDSHSKAFFIEFNLKLNLKCRHLKF